MSKKNTDAARQTATSSDQELAAEQVAVEESLAEENGGKTAGEPEEMDEVITLKQQVDELKDKYLRLSAEFENYKKRTIREKLDWMKTAAQDTLSALLPVLDDFDRAKKFASENMETSWSEGVDLVYQKLYNSLKNKGLEPMDSTGAAFDPELHDAITEIPAPTEDLKGKVIDTIEKGYFLNEKIIRHAKVVVGK